MVKEDAKRYINAGLSALPAMVADKRPTGYPWKKYQTKIMELAELPLFDNYDAVCIICGEVSGGLEVIDFDDGGSQFGAWLASIDQAVADQVVAEKSPSGGYHVFYRAAEIEGNQKLAKDESGKILIETRGEGGLILCAPSPGYEMIKGDIANVQTVTAADRQHMLDAARVLNRHDGSATSTVAATVAIGDLGTPWREYNERGNFRAVLERHGWSMIRQAVAGDDNERWRRPGKTDGHSATINSESIFYCWTSNAPPFDNEKGYAPFEVFKLLEHEGRFGDALAAIKEMGYGNSEDSLAVLAASNILRQGPGQSRAKPEHKKENPDFPQELRSAPGLIGQIIDYAMEVVRVPQYSFALSAALCVQSLCVGRKIMDDNDCRPNVLTINLGKSGSGKEGGRKVIRKLMHAAGNPDMVGPDNVMSGTAILSELEHQPVIAIMLDEVHSLMTSLAQRNPPRHLTLIAENIKTAYTSADNDHWIPGSYADRNKRIVINQPHLVMYATGTSTAYWSAMTDDLMINGFMGRMLMFESDPEAEETGNPWRNPDPESEMVMTIKRWLAWNPGGNLADENPDPIVVPYSKMAEYRMRQHCTTIRDRCKGEEDAEHAMWARTGQKTLQLAMLYAASRCGPGTLQIEIEDVDRAIMLSNWSTRRVIWNTENPSAGEYGQIADLVLRKIPRSWTTKSEITRMTYRICPRQQREQVFKDHVESGEIEIRQVGEGRNQRTEFRRVAGLSIRANR